MAIDTHAALQHFQIHDPIMHRALASALESNLIVVPEPLAPEQYFARIVRSIISQQISTKAAASVRGRVEELLGEVEPETVLAVSEEKLRSCGLSGQKTRYIRENAAVWREIPYGDFAHMDDEAVITELTKLYGIGRWTAQMFLIFSLARPDVFSFGDLALVQGLYQTYNYKPHYTRKIKNTVEGWSPHRTLASLTLWRMKDTAPVVL